MNKLTRRQVLAAAAISTAGLDAQTSTPGTGESPQGWAKAARETNARNTEALAKFNVPLATEPAFAFKA